MPKVKLHPLIVEIHGTMNDMVFKKSRKGEMMITKKPDMSKVKWSKAQKDQRKRFKQAVLLVQTALKDPKVRARYDRKAKKQDKRAWDLAMSDYFKGRDLYARRSRSSSTPKGKPATNPPRTSNSKSPAS